MPPIRPDDYSYRFRPAMLRELRGQLKMTQAQMADLLEIPVNTLSRWELGSNLPDANALAAVYSIAAERGVKPQFFEERRKTISKPKKRKNRIIDWDFQNLGIGAEDIGETCDGLNQYLDILFGRSSDPLLYAYAPFRMGGFSRVDRSPQGQALQKAGFKVVACQSDADRKIMEDGKELFDPSSDFNPKESVYVLVSDDGDYAEFLKGFRAAGVEVFVFGTDECSQKLVKSVGQDHFIPWQRPYMVVKCYEVALELVGSPITKSAFGDRCRQALGEDGLEGDEYEELLEDSGFSLNRPFASALQHMHTMDILNVKPTGNDPARVTITLPGT